MIQLLTPEQIAALASLPAGEFQVLTLLVESKKAPTKNAGPS